MLNRIELSNFRAFKTESFDFGRLNIFVGPNNSGKSSALSAINLLAQSATSESFGGGPVILNGPFDQLGTYKDMVHGGRANTPIRISLTVNSFVYEFELKYRAQRREVELSRFKLTFEGRPVYEYISSKDKYSVIIGGRDVDDIGVIKKSRPRFMSFIPIFAEAFRYQQMSRIDSAPYSDSTFEFLRTQERIISNFRRVILEMFRSYDTLGAFREMPQRTYLQSGETASKIGRFGQNTVTMLASDSSKRGNEQIGYVDEISRWLQATGIASGIRVKYLTERHFELVVIGRDGSDHNICDVGFGCSQVLPVLVAGIDLSNRAKRSGQSGNPTLVIQEPEIHLHPNAQAALGSFFASLAKLKCQVFIETHSDNLVLRIARHVAAGDIAQEDVRIFYVQDADGLKKVTPIQISGDGSFNPPWPGGFFPQRQAESFELAKAASRKERHPEPSFDFIYPKGK